MERLTEKIQERLFHDYVTEEFLFPYEKGGLVSFFLQNSHVLEQKYVENGVHLVVNCHQSDASKYQDYRIGSRKG